MRFAVLLKNGAVKVETNQTFDQISIIKVFDLDTRFISNLSFNSVYSTLGISTNKVINQLFGEKNKFY